MPLNGSGTASKPSGTTASPNTTIESAKFNSVIDDIYSILNTARPVLYGGTGGTTAAEARTNLGLASLYSAFTAASAAGPASLALAEDTDSGTNKVTVQAPSALGADVIVTLPDATGTLYSSGGTDVALADGGTGASLTDPNADRILFWDDSAGAMTWLTTGAGLAITGTTIDSTAGIILGTPQSPSGVSSVDFTSIPSTAKQIVVMWQGLSSASNSTFGLQIGDSGGAENTGYAFGVMFNNGSAGYTQNSAASQWQLGTVQAANALSGVATLTLMDASTFTWAVTIASGPNATAAAGDIAYFGSGFKSTSAALDRIRIISGTGNFDAGKINIAYF